MRYQAVIFDFDGTLFDTEYEEMRSLEELVTQATGVRPPQEKLRQTFSMTGPDGIRFLGCSEEQAAWVGPRWHEASVAALGKVPLFDGMRETIAQLRAQGARLGIVTSRGANSTRFGLEAAGWLDDFEQILCPKDTEHHKPHPEPLLECLRRMDVSPADAIYIGDSARDMACAAAAGVASGLALWGTHEPELSCTYRLTHPSDLIEICKGEA